MLAHPGRIPFGGSKKSAPSSTALFASGWDGIECAYTTQY